MVIGQNDSDDALDLPFPGNVQACLGDQGKFEGKSGSLPLFTCHKNTAVMFLHDTIADSKSQASPAFLG